MFQIKFSCCCCKTYISLCTWGKCSYIEFIHGMLGKEIPELEQNVKKC